MNENRKQILEMLAAGQITADEAERLISALEKEPAAGAPSNGTEAHPKPKPKYLRVLVQAEEGKEGDAPTKVNVRVPLQLLRSGVRLANFIPAQARDRANDAMRENGVPFDLGQIKPDNLEDIIDQLNDLTVDVDHIEKDSNVKVRIFCE